MLVAGIGLLTPLFTKGFFDNAYPARDHSLTTTLLIGSFATTIGAAVMNAVRGYYGQCISTRMSTDLGLMFFNRLQHQTLETIEGGRVGDTYGRTADLQRSVAFVSNLFRTILLNGLYLCLIPPVLIMLNWRLALLAFVATPITSLLSIQTGRRIRVAMQRTAESSADSAALQTEALARLRLIKSLAAEPSVFARVRLAQTRARDSSLSSASLSAILGGVNSLFRAAGTLVYAYYAWHLLLRNQLSLGDYVAFSAYMGYLAVPVGQMTGLFLDFQQASIALSRFFESYDGTVEREPVPAVSPWPGIRAPARLDIEGVCFSYTAGQRLLTDVHLSVGAGEVIALCGPSGCGKSSLAALISHLYVPRSGTIRIDGTPTTEYDLTDLRRRIGVVSQDVAALRGSIRDNLLLGNRERTDDELWSALRVADLEDFVRRLPEGLSADVLEGGVSLSAGQRQRLAISRVILREPGLLILDEATANLDEDAERAVLQRVLSLRKRMSIILVTHRPQNADLADRVYQVIDGRLALKRVNGGPALNPHVALKAQQQTATFAGKPEPVSTPTIAVSG